MSPRLALTSIILFLILHSVKPQNYSDSRPVAKVRMNAKDTGIVMRYGDGPDSCDIIGARDVWVFKANDSTFCMHYDAAGPKGWLASLAISKDLIHWEKKGPVLQLGNQNGPDSKSASYGTTYYDGKKWHMFYLGTPNVTPAPDLIPSFPYLNMKENRILPLVPGLKDETLFHLTPERIHFTVLHHLRVLL